MRIPHVFLKYSGPKKVNSGESKRHAHGRDMLWRNLTKGQYENRVTAPWEIMRQHSAEVDFRLSFESDRWFTCAADHVRDVIYPVHMVDKTKYVIAFLRSISKYHVLRHNHL